MRKGFLYSFANSACDVHAFWAHGVIFPPSEANCLCGYCDLYGFRGIIGFAPPLWDRNNTLLAKYYMHLGVLDIFFSFFLFPFLISVSGVCVGHTRVSEVECKMQLIGKWPFSAICLFPKSLIFLGP